MRCARSEILPRLEIIYIFGNTFMFLVIPRQRYWFAQRPRRPNKLHELLREGIEKKNRFFLGKSPKLWVGGGQES